jgi:adenylate cyclase
MKMGPKAREFERKFLLKEMPLGLQKLKRTRIRQGYLAIEPRGAHVRLRKRDGAHTLTFKRGPSHDREEREVRLTAAQFRVLWPGTEGRRLTKTRYEMQWRRWTIEIDVYHGINRGLVVAEVEFSNAKARDQFAPPDWFGKEISGSRRYSNLALARE